MMEARQDNFLVLTANHITQYFRGENMYKTEISMPATSALLDVCKDLDTHGEVRLNKLFILRLAPAEPPVVHFLIGG